MSGLTDAERWSLRDKALWSQSQTLFANVEQIIDARVTAALNEAADAVNAAADVHDARRKTAYDSAYADGAVDGLEEAERIVRAAATPKPPRRATEK